MSPGRAARRGFGEKSGGKMAGVGFDFPRRRRQVDSSRMGTAGYAWIGNSDFFKNNTFKSKFDKDSTAI
jgi:hypothetical protein